MASTTTGFSSLVSSTSPSTSTTTATSTTGTTCLASANTGMESKSPESSRLLVLTQPAPPEMTMMMMGMRTTTTATATGLTTTTTTTADESSLVGSEDGSPSKVVLATKTGRPSIPESPIGINEQPQQNHSPQSQQQLHSPGSSSQQSQHENPNQQSNQNQNQQQSINCPGSPLEKSYQQQSPPLKQEQMTQESNLSPQSLPSPPQSQQQQQQQQHNHHNQQQQQQHNHHQQHTQHQQVQQLIVTNGELKPAETAVIVTSDNIKSEYLTQQHHQQQQQQQQHNGSSHSPPHQQIFQHHEIHIKAEPLDPMPPLASPAQVVDVVANSQMSPDEKNRDLEPSPPTTVISLAPAQPYPPGTTQLTFAAPAYDLGGTGQYTVQVNAAEVPSLYAAVTQQPDVAGRNNGGTVYITDYITYRDYYQTASTGGGVTTGDQYQTVRQHLSATPASVTYTTQASNENSGETTTSFLDRYLRQQPSNNGGNNNSNTNTNNNNVGVVANYKNSQIHVDLPSPDSGIGEATITPRGDNGALPQIFDYTELSQAQAILPISTASNAATVVDQAATVTVTTPGPITVLSHSGSNSNSSTASTTGGASAKSTGSSRRLWHECGRNSEVDKVQIPKIFSDVGFKYYLESPISTSQRREDDRITYINKGQFYGITLEYIPDPDRPLKSATVKSLVLLVFREEKSHEDEIKAWQFWHSRQHSVKQRILDADTKNSTGIVGPIEEVTHNSIAFYWNPLEGPAKINIAVQCLSTDFSNQKGVKGLPLHLQIDTFDDFREGSLPVHRGYGQIKVFCDKGAERKTRDEERRAAKRKLSATGNGRKKIEEMYHPPADRSEFYQMSDLLKPPVLFTPNEELDKITTGDMNFYSSQHSSSDLNGSGYDSPTHLTTITAATTPPGIEKRERTDPLTASVEMAIVQPPPAKRVKVYPQDRVLIYAKQENEEVFHPLHLIPPTLIGLAMAIQNKYKLDAKNIRHIYKRCTKGITVQMDDDMVKHYSNEDTVLLEVHQVDEHTHDITLVEFDISINN